jgi:hypothetical protein
MLKRDTRRLTAEETQALREYLAQQVRRAPYPWTIRSVFAPLLILGIVLLLILSSCCGPSLGILGVVGVATGVIGLLTLAGFLAMTVARQRRARFHDALLPRLDTDQFEVTNAVLTDIHLFKGPFRRHYLVGVIDRLQLLTLRGQAVFPNTKDALRHVTQSHLTVIRDPSTDRIVYLRSWGAPVPVQDAANTGHYLENLTMGTPPAVDIFYGSYDELGMDQTR